MKAVEYLGKDYDVEDWVEYLFIVRGGTIIGSEKMPIKTSSGMDYVGRAMIVGGIKNFNLEKIRDDDPRFFTELLCATLQKVKTKQDNIDVFLKARLLELCSQISSSSLDGVRCDSLRKCISALEDIV